MATTTDFSATAIWVKCSVICRFCRFEIPAIRTLLTVIVASLFILFRQEIQPFALLVYSASLLLIYDPFSILSAAFWLSYGACFILLRVYQTIHDLPKIRWQPKRRN